MLHGSKVYQCSRYSILNRRIQITCSYPVGQPRQPTETSKFKDSLYPILNVVF
ncbi:unnamed protein product, partial [Leptidea sinapis]